jgi:hypothetical protein
MVVLKYLTPSSQYNNSNSSIELEAVQERMNYMSFWVQEEIDNITKISRDEKNIIIHEIRNKWEQEGDTLLKAIENSLKEKLYSDNFELRISETKQRLDKEREDLAKRGNINLLLGMLLSFIGIGMLGFSVFAHNIYLDFNDFIFHALPKMLFVFLIEIFAYFFLKLYKQSIDDIKYYQN